MSIRHAMDILQWHFGMAGLPRPKRDPGCVPFAKAFVAAIQTRDEAAFCLLAPLLLLNEWGAPAMLEACPTKARPRLRLAAEAALFLASYSTAQIYNSHLRVAELNVLANELAGETLAGDTWDNPRPNCPQGIYTPFWERLGLRCVWRLDDLTKRYDWVTQHWHRWKEEYDVRKTQTVA